MAGNFSLKKFSDIDLNDPFFDSLKADYPGWRQSKAIRGVVSGKSSGRPYSFGIRR